MFGWDFNFLLLAIHEQTCEALYAASRLSEAVESLRSMSDEFGAEMKTSVKLGNWVSGAFLVDGHPNLSANPWY